MKRLLFLVFATASLASSALLFSAESPNADWWESNESLPVALTFVNKSDEPVIIASADRVMPIFLQPGEQGKSRFRTTGTIVIFYADTPELKNLTPTTLDELIRTARNKNGDRFDIPDLIGQVKHGTKYVIDGFYNFAKSGDAVVLQKNKAAAVLRRNPNGEVIQKNFKLEKAYGQ